MFIRELHIKYRNRRVPKKAYYCIGGQATSAVNVVNIFYKEMQQETVEKFLVIHLNNQNIIESFQTVSIGTLNSASVAIRDVFKAALIANCAAIICLHNHPSGNCNPSREDKEITEQINDAGKLLRIKVLDHIIIGEGSYYSITNNHRRSITI